MSPEVAVVRSVGADVLGRLSRSLGQCLVARSVLGHPVTGLRLGASGQHVRSGVKSRRSFGHAVPFRRSVRSAARVQPVQVGHAVRPVRSVLQACVDAVSRQPRTAEWRLPGKVSWVRCIGQVSQSGRPVRSGWFRCPSPIAWSPGQFPVAQVPSHRLVVRCVRSAHSVRRQVTAIVCSYGSASGGRQGRRCAVRATQSGYSLAM